MQVSPQIPGGSLLWGLRAAFAAGDGSAALDERTCRVCGGQGGRVHRVEEAQTGLNYPPLHANCRCTTLPVIEGLPEEGGLRAARDGDGGYVLVPENMTYEQWEDGLKDAKSRAIVNLNKGLHGLPNGLRRPKGLLLTPDNIVSLRADIEKIQADPDVFLFNEGPFTGYQDDIDIIYVRGDVLPDEDSLHPRDRMSPHAVLAHEYYGHRAQRYTPLPQGSWNDEFRTSYMTALNTPGLTKQDRSLLIQDAMERAKAAGVTIRLNGKMKEVLYGY